MLTIILAQVLRFGKLSSGDRAHSQPIRTRPVACRLGVELLDDRLLLSSLPSVRSLLHPSEPTALAAARRSRAVAVTVSDEGRAIVADPDGNTYVAGTLLHNDGVADSPKPSRQDIFVAKYAPDGSPVWQQKIGSAGDDRARGIARDSLDNLYVTGAFQGTVNFNPTGAEANLTSAGGFDIFVLKLDANGVFQWVRSFGGRRAVPDIAYGISVDSADNVLVTGQFGGVADFDPTAGTFNLMSAGGADVFVLKMSADGSLVWARRMGGRAADRGTAVATDRSGRVYTTGSFSGVVDFDPSPAAIGNLASAGGSDVFVSVLEPNGEFAFARRLGGKAADEAHDIEVDSNGGISTTGYFAGKADFDPGAGVQLLTSAGKTDVFLSKLDSAGGFAFAQRVGGTGDDRGRGLVIGSDDSIAITGHFAGKVDFDPGSGVANLISAGLSDAFFAQFSATGSYLSAQRVGGKGMDLGRAIARDARGKLFATGFNAGAATLQSTGGPIQLAGQGRGVLVVEVQAPEDSPPVLDPIGDQSIDEGRSLSFMIANDAGTSHGSGRGLTYSASGLPAGATFDPARRSFQWTPGEDQDGTFRVTFGVSNGATTDSKTIQITVREVDQPPILAPIGNQSLDEGSLLGFTIAAVDADIVSGTPNTLTYSASGLPRGATFDPTSRSFRWTPGENQDGMYDVVVSVSDGMATDSETIRITVREVNQAPVLTPIDSKSVDEGSPLSVTIVATDTDLVSGSSNPLSYSASGLPAGATFDPAGRSFRWTPGEEQDGNYIVNFSVSDGTATDGQTIRITVRDVNQAPVLTPLGSKSVDEGSPLTFTIVATDTDLVSGLPNALSYSASGLPARATFDSASRSFRWTPAENQDGTYTVTFSVSDGTATRAETVRITVREVNQAPVLTPIGDQSLDEGSPLSFTIAAADGDNVAGSPNPLSYTASGLPTGATFDPASRTLRWTPGESQDGTYPVTFRVSDGNATDDETIRITVREVSQPPVLAPIIDESTDEGSPLSFTIAATDPDLVNGASSPLSYSASGLPAGATLDPVSREFRWTPREDQDGTYQVTFSVSDGTATVSQAIAITAREVNETPVLSPIGDQSIDEGSPLSFTIAATDADLVTGSPSPLRYSASGLPAGATFDPTSREFRWTPREDQDGTHSVSFMASDGTASASTTIMLTVGEVNEPPTLEPIGNQSVDGDNQLGFTVWATDSDVVGGRPSTLSYSAEGLPTGATFDPDTGVFDWTPTLSDVGAYFITFTASDGAAVSSETVAITVSGPAISSPEQAEQGAFPKAGVFSVPASGETDTSPSPDDPAIWVHPTDPALSVVVATDKSTAGGLRLYDLDGHEIQFVKGGKYNNVDLRYGFPLAGTTVDLVSTTNRTINNIDLYKLEAPTRRLSKVGSIHSGVTVYGYTMYHSQVTGKFYGIIIGKDGRVEQWELSDDGSGQVTGRLVRQFDVGGQSEGSVADDELGYLYISEENVGIWKYSAEPDGGSQRTPVDSTGLVGHLTADAEGLAIYHRPDGEGYLLASSQGNSRYTVYRRESANEYLATFQISGGLIDGTSATDGIEVVNMALGSRYPLGLFVVHDDQNEGATQNFKFVGWDEIANRLGLTIDTRVDVRASAM